MCVRVRNPTIGFIHPVFTVFLDKMQFTVALGLSNLTMIFIVTPLSLTLWSTLNKIQKNLICELNKENCKKITS